MMEPSDLLGSPMPLAPAVPPDPLVSLGPPLPPGPPAPSDPSSPPGASARPGPQSPPGPSAPPGALAPPGPPRRQRQERTVYSKEQQQVLERKFRETEYPKYEEKAALARQLNLKEHQVQVWFKNRRAKNSREALHRAGGAAGGRGRGARAVLAARRGARAAPPDRQACAPGPGPADAGPPAVQGSAGLFALPLPGPLGVFSAAESPFPGLGQAWEGPGCSAQEGVLAAGAPAWACASTAAPAAAANGAPTAPPNGAPAAAPAPFPAPWPQGPHAPDLPGPFASIPDFTDLLSPIDTFEDPLVSATTFGYQDGGGTAGRDESGQGRS